LLGAVEADRLLGRGADHHAGLTNRPGVRFERDGDAKRRPVVGTTGGALEVGGAARTLGRDAQLGDDLVAPEHGFVITGKEIFDFEGALAAATGHYNAGVERDEYWRQVHVRIAVSEAPSDGRHIAHPYVGKSPHGAHDHARTTRHLARALDEGEWRQ